MNSPPQWACKSCSTGNDEPARFCINCGLPRGKGDTEMTRTPWYERRRVWFGAGALVVLALFLVAVSLAPPSDEEQLPESAANTDTFAAAYNAHIGGFFEAAEEFERSRDIDAATLLAGGIGESVLPIADAAVAWGDVSERFRAALLEHSAPTGCADFHLELIDAQNAAARIGQLGERFLASYDGERIPAVEGGWLPRFDAEHEASLDALTRARVLGADCGFLK